MIIPSPEAHELNQNLQQRTRDMAIIPRTKQIIHNNRPGAELKQLNLFPPKPASIRLRAEGDMK